MPARGAAEPRATCVTSTPSAAAFTSTPTERSPLPATRSTAGRASTHARHDFSNPSSVVANVSSIARRPVRSSAKVSTYRRYQFRSLPWSAMYSNTERTTG